MLLITCIQSSNSAFHISTPLEYITISKEMFEITFIIGLLLYHNQHGVITRCLDKTQSKWNANHHYLCYASKILPALRSLDYFSSKTGVKTRSFKFPGQNHNHSFFCILHNRLYFSQKTAFLWTKYSLCFVSACVTKDAKPQLQNKGVCYCIKHCRLLKEITLNFVWPFSGQLHFCAAPPWEETCSSSLS